jgi:site-specific DNA-methyltransferase (adenine-specific)
MDARRHAHGTRPADYGGGDRIQTQHTGRWPTNVVLDESQAAELDKQTGITRSRVDTPRGSAAPGVGWGMTATDAEYDDSGGASRFFPVFKYQAKAPARERPKVDGVAHPTVKPLELMRWLVRLVTPPGGLVLDPFAGTGTTGEACLYEGCDSVLIESNAEYLPLIEERLTRPRGER